MFPEGLTCLIVFALGGLLVCEAQERRLGAFWFKSGASLGFVVLGLAMGALTHGTAARVLLLGLALAALGDVALALHGNRSFLVGLLFFLAGHVAYVVAFALLAPVATWLSFAMVVPMVATTAAYVWLAPRLGSMRVPVLAYMATITVMVIGALAVSRAGGQQAPRLLAGAVLFYLSDLSVARDRFVKRQFVNRAWGLPAYYAAQILIAWAIGG
jgi:uncharacterized membrane protein YhhN